MRAPIALITGASRGIGRSIALRLAADGHRVVLNDHPSQSEALHHTVDQLKRGGAANTSGFVADVAIEREVTNMVDSTRELGGLDVMVANAGIVILKPFTDCTVEDYLKISTINTLGTFLCYRNAARLMVEQARGGRIVGASSLAGQQGLPLFSLYSLTKFAIRGLTQAAAKELAVHGITVNAYAPGPVDTVMMKQFEDDMTKYLPSKEVAAQLSIMPPLGRYGKPDEVAGLVSYLASKDAHFVTGQTIGINGGVLG